MFKLGSVVVDYEANTKPFEGGVKKVNDAIKDTGAQTTNAQGKVSKFGSAGQRAFAMSAGAAGAGMLLSVLGKIINEAQRFNDELDNALARSRGSLDLTAEETEKMGERAKQAYLDGFGTSISDVTVQLTNMQKQIQSLGDVSDEEFRSIANDILGITDVFQQDADKLSMGVNTLMTEFGISAKEATTMIASGLQNGLDNSGDFLDTINEYSVQYAGAGASADEFFNSLELGQKSGVLGTDKIADMFKEFTIRIQDGSEKTQKALNAINLGTIPEQIKSGEITVSEAYSKITESLASIEDPIQRNKTAVELLGTQFEDLGLSQEILAGQSDLGVESFSDNTEALEAVASAYDTTQLKGEALQRQMEITRAEALEPLTDAVNQAKLQFFELMMPLAENKPLLIGIVTAIGLLSVAMAGFSLVMAVSLIPTMWAAATAGWALMAPFLPIVGIVLGVIAAVGLLAWAITANWDTITAAFNAGVSYIRDVAIPAFMNGLNNAWTGVKNFGQRVGDVFNQIKNAVGGAMKFVANAVVGQFNVNIRGINALINGANRIPGVNLPTVPLIPRFAQGVTNFGGGMAMINDGVSNEALRVGDITYLPQSTDVINGGATNDLINQSSGGTQQVITMKDIKTPMIRAWLKENLTEFSKAGIQLKN